MSTGYDKNIRLWDTETGKVRGGVLFALCSGWLSSKGKSIRLRDTETGKVDRAWRGERDALFRSFAVRAKGPRLFPQDRVRCTWRASCTVSRYLVFRQHARRHRCLRLPACLGATPASLQSLPAWGRAARRARSQVLQTFNTGKMYYCVTLHPEKQGTLLAGARPKPYP